jgi:hypothetical protein
MDRESHFRKILPTLQTIVAVAFGGWGLWVRNAILSRPFVLGMTGWESTARFHVWPWPYKFAAVLNMPALLAGALVSWPFNALLPVLSGSLSVLLTLLFVFFLWYWIGSWLDQGRFAHKSKSGVKGQWTLVVAFVAICAAASSIPQSIGGHVSFFPAGILIWLIAAIGMAPAIVRQKR